MTNHTEAHRPPNPLSLEQANRLIAPLFAQPISRAWKGYGTAIFLEIGKLTQIDALPDQDAKGEFSIYIGWDWRVEDGARVRFGSANTRSEMASGLATLVGLTLSGLAIQGPVPEIVLTLSNGQRLISAAMATDVSEWSIRLPGPVWITCDEGSISCDDGAGPPMSDAECAEFAWAETTTRRWGVPSTDCPPGQCRLCLAMRRIDGDANFLDYGVCTNEASPFDGRVINIASGCQAFICGGD